DQKSNKEEEKAKFHQSNRTRKFNMKRKGSQISTTCHYEERSLRRSNAQHDEEIAASGSSRYAKNTTRPTARVFSNSEKSPRISANLHELFEKFAQIRED